MPFCLRGGKDLLSARQRVNGIGKQSPCKCVRKTYLQQNVLQPMMNAATPDGSIYGNEASYLFKD
jgi:hypothetical protein